MKNKYIISDNFKELMTEVNNPKRPPKGWEGVMEYDLQHYNDLLDIVFSEIKYMAKKYGIELDEAWFKNHIEYLFVGIEQCSLFKIERKCYDTASRRTDGRCEGEFVLIP